MEPGTYLLIDYKREEEIIQCNYKEQTTKDKWELLFMEKV